MDRMEQKSVRLGKRFGYSVASITDAANFTFMNSYILFFLTTVCGVNPAAAGTITAIGTILSSVWSPVVGFLSDRCPSRFGRRRPFLMAAIIPLIFSLFLCFTNVGLSGPLKNVYYCFGVTLFWCTFSTFYSPWLTLAAELTDDYNERTAMRSITYAIAQVGTLLGMAAPPLLVGWIAGLGFSQARSWTITALIIGAIAGASLLVTITSTAGSDRPLKKELPAGPADSSQSSPAPDAQQPAAASGLKELFREYWQVIRLKPMICIMLMSLGHMTAQGIFYSGRAYLFEYHLQLPSAKLSLAVIFSAAAGMILSPLVNQLSKKMDKRAALILLLILAAALMIVGAAAGGIGSFLDAVLLAFAFAIGNAAFWQLMPVMLYDVCEYDAWKNRRQRRGVIVAVQPLLETICSGLATLMLGIILDLSGFDGESAVQRAGALAGIKASYSIVPAALMIFAAAMTVLYPISRKKYEQIKRELAERH